jgi:O-antigen biosynthesis protein WbqP
MKRAFDLVVSALGLAVAAPVILLCMAAIRVDSPGSPIFRQSRVGRGERVFTCFKLRTMRVDTEDRPSHEVSRDAVTTVGAFMRRTKLDELPQLWNVLRGDMSFVGPRPCLPSQHELIEARRALGLQELRPGITGIAQVAGIDMSEPQRLAAVDARYLEQMSLWTDIMLILKTVLGSGRGDRTRTLPQ